MTDAGKTVKLAIFDLDGTLTRTNKVDEACFIHALAEEFDVTEPDTDWSSYTHTTDPGITREILKAKLGRPATAGEVERVMHRLVALLDQASLKEPDHFVEIPGASQALGALSEDPDWCTAIATGAWESSARLKLQRAKIDVLNLPTAFADGLISRESIIKEAIRQSRARYRQAEFDRIVSIGDAVWDVRTARHLGISFLGVGRGNREATLRAEGASHVIADFRNWQRFIDRLENAKTPSG